MEWKVVDVYPDFKGLYKVSEFGDVVSLPRQVRVFREDTGFYYRTNGARNISARRGNKNPHLMVDFYKTTVTDDGDKTKFFKTVYVHKLVALMFLPNPRNKRFVEHLDDDYDNNHYSNLRWVNQDEVSRRTINERYPENKNLLRDANIKSGYYKNARPNRKPIDKTKLYYQLKGNRIISNRTGRSAILNAVVLKPVYDEFKHKITSKVRFRFKALTLKERNRIDELIITNHRKLYSNARLADDK